MTDRIPQPSVEELIARHLAARDSLVDAVSAEEWRAKSPALRADYLAYAREVTAIVQAADPVPAPTDQAACPAPIERSHEAALGETRARVERLALAFEVSGNEFLAERIRAALDGEPAAVLPEPTAPTAWAYEQVSTALTDHQSLAEVRRLALSAALSLGTGASWDVLRDRAAELAALAALTPCTCRQIIHKQEHRAPVAGCPWCTAAERDAAQQTDGAETASCSARPCNAAADELCDNHARIRYHAEGEHAFCEPGCTEEA